MDLTSELSLPWKVLVAGLILFMQLTTSAHALVFKRDHRSALMWTGFIWFVPVIGAVGYVLLGINRIKRRAAILRKDHRPLEIGLKDHPSKVKGTEVAGFGDLVELVERVVDRPLVQGNAVRVLVNGDEAFPEMLRAITEARTSITLSSYIFDYDQSGRKFIEALHGAHHRGVKVRTLVDDVGSRYSTRSVTRLLREAGIRSARFLPRSPLRRFVSLNLRNHRKILVIDGRVAFTGGMNIRHGNCLQQQPAHPIQDIHFRVEGPVVTQLQECFADDWLFCTGERLAGERWFPELSHEGNLAARVIPDGPDEDFDKLAWTLYGGISSARRSIQIVTPYFLPEREMITMLNVAALRGVQVDLVLPARNNYPFMTWASRASWSLLLERGCRIWLTPPPFDHSKILMVDGQWSLIGSANLDPRSLRLNFEVMVEVYGESLALRLGELVREKMGQAQRVTLAAVNGRTLAGKLRDGLARVFTPYL